MSAAPELPALPELGPEWTPYWTNVVNEKLRSYGAACAAAEREACAKVCEGRIGGAVQNNEWWIGFRSAMKQCAESIRARGAK